MSQDTATKDRDGDIGDDPDSSLAGGTSLQSQGAVGTGVGTITGGGPVPSVTPNNGDMTGNLIMKILKVDPDTGGKKPCCVIEVKETQGSLKLQLRALRNDIGSRLEFPYGFCTSEGAGVPETMTIGDYFDHVEPQATVNTGPPAPPKIDPSEMKAHEDASQKGSSTETPSKDESKLDKLLVGLGGEKSEALAPPAEVSSITEQKSKPQKIDLLFVHERKVKVKKRAEDVVAKGEFILKFIQKAKPDINSGSLESSFFRNSKTTISLADLRSHIKPMSSNPSNHEFCFRDETSVGDTMLLHVYLAETVPPEEFDAEMPKLQVFFRKTGSKPVFGAADDATKEFAKTDKFDPTFNARDTSHDATIAGLAAQKTDLNNLGFSAEELKALAPGAISQFLHAGELDEIQWATVLRNCNLMHGWCFDLGRNEVRRAPKPAFRLREGLNIPSEFDASLPLLGSNVKKFDIPPSKPPEKAGAKDAEKSNADQKEGKDLSSNKSSGNDVTSDGKGTLSAKGNASPGIIEKAPIKKPNAIPSFIVTDESKIEVTLVSHQLQRSMATNNFASSSFQAGASGTIKGVNVGANYGRAEESSSGFSKSSDKLDKTMIGTYRFPRATVFLRSADLEPTEELKLALRRVERSKNIDDLKELHAQFGHTFPTEFVLGGRLLTTRIFSAEENISETKSSEQMKQNIGLSVSVPGGPGGSLKHEKTKGSNQEDLVKEVWTKDRIMFEASGGNTILAADPPRWCASVLDFRNWRVVEQGTLLPLATAIGTCANSEYEKVAEWFVQAVPARSLFNAVPPSREFHVRLKLTREIESITNQMLADNYRQDVCTYLGHRPKTPIAPKRHGITRRETREIKKKSSETQFGIKRDHLITIAQQFDLTDTVALFSPKSFQGPVLLQYPDEDRKKKVMESLEAYSETIWSMIVVSPHKYLQDGTLVVFKAFGPGKPLKAAEADKLAAAAAKEAKDADKAVAAARKDDDDANDAKSAAKAEKNDTKIAETTTKAKEASSNSEQLAQAAEEAKATADAAQANADAANNVASWHQDLYLTIIRNEQGHFLPAISSSTEAAMWRLHKLESVKTGGEAFERGESVRLSWRFEDQTAGFRDFSEDVFGRLRHNLPDKAPQEFFLKFPFPGFETQKEAVEGGRCMIMNGHKGLDPKYETLQVRSYPPEEEKSEDLDFEQNEVLYGLFDLSFRLDVLADAGRPLLFDYMMWGIDQTAVEQLQEMASERSSTNMTIDGGATAVNIATDVVGSAMLGLSYPFVRKEFKAVASAITGFVGDAWSGIRGMFGF